MARRLNILVSNFIFLVYNVLYYQPVIHRCYTGWHFLTRKGLFLSRRAIIHNFKHWVSLSWTTKRKDTRRWKWLPECHAEKWHSKGNLSTVLDGRQAQYLRASTTLLISYEGSLARALPNFKTIKFYLIQVTNWKVSEANPWISILWEPKSTQKCIVL